MILGNSFLSDYWVTFDHSTYADGYGLIGFQGKTDKTRELIECRGPKYEDKCLRNIGNFNSINDWKEAQKDGDDMDLIVLIVACAGGAIVLTLIAYCCFRKRQMAGEHHTAMADAKAQKVPDNSRIDTNGMSQIELKNVSDDEFGGKTLGTQKSQQ